MKNCLGCSKDLTGLKRKWCSRECITVFLRRPDEIARRFWAKVKKADGDGCWIWQGARSLSRYGTANYCGTNMNAHRVAWIITYGPIAPGLDVLHRCNNGHLGCVTPLHLYLGTDKENCRDRIQAGAWPTIEQQKRRFDAETVRAIRAMQGLHSSSEVAALFKTSYRQVAKIWARQVYKRVA